MCFVLFFGVSHLYDLANTEIATSAFSSSSFLVSFISHKVCEKFGLCAIFGLLCVAFVVLRVSRLFNSPKGGRRKGPEDATL